MSALTKRSLAVLLAAAAVTILPGCGDKPESNVQENAQQPAVSPAEREELQARENEKKAAAKAQHEALYKEAEAAIEQIARNTAEGSACLGGEMQDRLLIEIPQEMLAYYQAHSRGPQDSPDFVAAVKKLEVDLPSLKLLARSGTKIDFSIPLTSHATIVFDAQKNVLMLPQQEIHEGELNVHAFNNATRLGDRDVQEFIGALTKDSPEKDKLPAKTIVKWEHQEFRDKYGEIRLPPGEKTFKPIGYAAFPVPVPTCMTYKR